MKAKQNNFTRSLFIFACVIWCMCEVSLLVIEEMRITDSYPLSSPDGYERAFPILQRLFICMTAMTAIIAAIRIWPKYFLLSAMASLVHLVYMGWKAYLLRHDSSKYGKPFYVISIIESIALGLCCILSLILEFTLKNDYNFT